MGRSTAVCKPSQNSTKSSGSSSGRVLNGRRRKSVTSPVYQFSRSSKAPQCWDSATLMAGTASFRIEDGAHPSGAGGIGEFYHFAIDWAPPMLYFTKDAGTEIAIHVPCEVPRPFFWGGQTFELDSQAPRWNGGRAVWDRMFALRKQNVTIVLEREPRASIPVLDWHLQRDKQEWSMMKPVIYEYYRNFWWDVVKPDFSKDARVLIIKRGNEIERRRSQEKAFEDGVEEAKTVLDNAKVKYDIVNMANKTFEEQVKLVAEARVVIGTHGASLSNAIFATNNSLLIEMGKRKFPCFANLAKQMGLSYQHYEDAHAVKHAIGAALEQAGITT